LEYLEYHSPFLEYVENWLVWISPWIEGLDTVPIYIAVGLIYNEKAFKHVLVETQNRGREQGPGWLTLHISTNKTADQPHC